MSEKGQILIVDDDPTLRLTIKTYLGKEGYAVIEAEDGQHMWTQLAAHPEVELVILDVLMPGEDGITIAARLRAQSPVGILMLTGKSDVIDRVVGLEVGADDYLPKPFDPRELLARVRSLLRRINLESPSAVHNLPSESPAPPTSAEAAEKFTHIGFAGWQLDKKRQELKNAQAESVVLTTKEFRLLDLFTTHPQEVLSRDQIMEFLSGRDWQPLDRSIDVLVLQLRKKLENDPSHPELIKTIRGSGYLFAQEIQNLSK